MTYKSITTRPIRAEDSNGNLLDINDINASLFRDIDRLTVATEWHLASDENLREDVTSAIDNGNTSINAKIGERIGIRLTDGFFPSGRSGRSRFERMFQDRVVREARSWAKRSLTTYGENPEYVSQGWSRTSSDVAPTDLKRKLSLSAAGDDRYVKFLDNPLTSTKDYRLKMVIDGNWVILTFPEIDSKRFKYAKKVCLPDIYEDNKGRIKFSFAIEYDDPKPEISSDYVIGIDVGKVEPLTISVISVSTGDIVHSTTLSRRIKSLNNSIIASEKQKNILNSYGRDSESVYHRESASRKKREFAIIAGQEVAQLSHDWGNALVVFEDLSWIINTMKNGRWNRGEVVKWTTHYVEQNGGRVYKANAAYSSQVCHKCHMKGSLHSSDRSFVCMNHDCLMIGVVQDRDVNAAGVIASRKVRDGSLRKTVLTRKNSKKFVKKAKSRTPRSREVLKYPGRDRSKHGPTKKRVKQRKSRCSRPKVIGTGVNDSQSTTSRTGCTVLVDVSEYVAPETVRGCSSSYYKNRRRARYSSGLLE